MSAGSGIGAVVGGVIGYFIGGPYGAAYGASIGFAIGAVADPIESDVPSIGEPNPEQVVMKSTIGDPCADLAGTVKIKGHLLCFGNERSEKVYTDSQASGGKGGGSPPAKTVSGFDYYMSWQLGVAACPSAPIDTLYAIYINEDDLLWEGPLNCPASGGKETIVIDDFGTIDFYFGTDDQVANTEVGTLISDDTLNSPLRYFSHAVMTDCFIGNYPRTPSLSFVVKRIPEVSFMDGETIQIHDVNPMHAIYYALYDLAGLPSTWFKESKFATAATTLSKEFRGVCVLFDESVSALTYVKGILDHIDGLLNYGNDGKFHPKLIRDDYDVDTLPTIDEDDIIGDLTMERRSWIDTINEKKIQYTQIYNVDRPKIYYGKLYWVGRNSWTVHSGNVSDTAGSAELVPNISSWKVGKVQGYGNAVFLFRDDGLVFSRGANSEYCCGVNSTASPVDWTQPSVSADVPNFWKTFGGGRNTSYGITQLGYLFAAGRNAGTTWQLFNAGTTVWNSSVFLQDVSGGTYTSVGKSWGSGYGAMIAVSDQTVANTFDSPIIYSNIVGKGRGDNGQLNRNRITSLTGPGLFAIRDGYIGDVLEVFGAAACTFFTTGREDNFVVYGTGTNIDGRIGVGSAASYISEFTAVVGTFKDFDVINSHCAGVGTDGRLYGWGSNTVYQLGQGIGDTTNRTSPVEIDLLGRTNWVKCAVTSTHTYALNEDGEIWVAGFDPFIPPSGSAAAAYTLQREQTNGTWRNIFGYATGCFFLK